MNDLQISITDIKKILIIATIVPIVSFVGGFSTAKFFEVDYSALLISADIDKNFTSIENQPALSDTNFQIEKAFVIEDDIVIEDETIFEDDIVIEGDIVIEEDVAFKEALTTFEPININQSLLSEAVESIQFEKRLENQLIDNKTPIIKVKTVNPYAVQAGVFAVYKNAASFQSGLLTHGIKTSILNDEYQSNVVYRVVLAKFETKAQARNAIIKLRNQYNIRLSLTELKDSDTKDDLVNKMAINY